MGVAATRLIDQEPEPPKDGAEVEVLVLGMPRTGTLCELDVHLVTYFSPNKSQSTDHLTY
jgi:hypothetical protein